MTLNNAIGNLRSKVAGLSGMKFAPPTPIENVPVFPFGVVYELSGRTNLLSANMADDIAILAVEIHVSRSLLPEAITRAMSFRDAFLATLIGDPALGGSVSTITGITRTFGRMEWGSIETIGYRFEIEVKTTI